MPSPTIRRRNHSIQVVWLSRDLTLEDHTERTAFGGMRKVFVTGHAGDALIVETTGDDQRFYFLSPSEYHERFETAEEEEAVYYERVAPSPRRGRDVARMPTRPLTAADLLPLHLPDHC